VNPRASLDVVEKRKFLTLSGLELRPLDRPARSQSLYKLRYPGSSTKSVAVVIHFLHQNEMPRLAKLGTKEAVAGKRLLCTEFFKPMVLEIFKYADPLALDCTL
jgi:hypothetical protein